MQIFNNQSENSVKGELPFFYIDIKLLSYFFGYKTEIFPFQNNPKTLDPSHKTDQDFGIKKR